MLCSKVLILALLEKIKCFIWKHICPQMGLMHSGSFEEKKKNRGFLLRRPKTYTAHSPYHGVR